MIRPTRRSIASPSGPIGARRQRPTAWISRRRGPRAGARSGVGRRRRRSRAVGRGRAAAVRAPAPARRPRSAMRPASSASVAARVHGVHFRVPAYTARDARRVPVLAEVARARSVIDAHELAAARAPRVGNAARRSTCGSARRGRRAGDRIRWVFEDDVGFCGDDLFAELIASYDGAAADPSPSRAPCAAARGEAHRRCARGTGPTPRAPGTSTAAAAAAALWARARGREHVQRLSARLLDRLHALARGAAARELLGRLRLLGVRQCARPRLPAAARGARRRALLLRRARERAWADIRRARSPRWRGKLYTAQW